MLWVLIPWKKNVNELNPLQARAKIDNKHPSLQDPNKIKVMTWIADRVDGKEHFLSFYRQGTAFPVENFVHIQEWQRSF